MRVSFDLGIHGGFGRDGTLRLLEAIQDYQHRTGIEVWFYQAGSSEMFGLVQQVPHRNNAVLSAVHMPVPRSMHWQTVNYRKLIIYLRVMEYCLTTSPRRGETFVTRKITRARPHSVGDQKKLHGGNLDAKRDWGMPRITSGQCG